MANKRRGRSNLRGTTTTSGAPGSNAQTMSRPEVAPDPRPPHEIGGAIRLAAQGAAGRVRGVWLGRLGPLRYAAHVAAPEWGAWQAHAQGRSA